MENEIKVDEEKKTEIKSGINRISISAIAIIMLLIIIISLVGIVIKYRDYERISKLNESATQAGFIAGQQAYYQDEFNQLDRYGFVIFPVPDNSSGQVRIQQIKLVPEPLKN